MENRKLAKDERKREKQDQEGKERDQRSVEIKCVEKERKMDVGEEGRALICIITLIALIISS